MPELGPQTYATVNAFIEARPTSTPSARGRRRVSAPLAGQAGGQIFGAGFLEANAAWSRWRRAPGCSRITGRRMPTSR